MNFSRLTALSLLVFPLLGFSAHAETNTVSGSAAAESAIAEWPYALPIFGKDAVEQGYEIPLPYGLGFSMMYAARDIFVEDVRLNIANSTITSVLNVNQFVDHDLGVGVDTKVLTSAARADAWLFPFMNVYGFVGHVDNESDVLFTIDSPNGLRDSLQADANPILVEILNQALITAGLPSGLDEPIYAEVPTTFDLSGPTYGGGVVLAGGYGDYFMTLDANFFKADLDGDVSETFSGSTYTARGGWNGKIKSVPSRFWLGMSYWNTSSEVTGDITLPYLGDVRFEVDQRPEEAVVYNLGSYIELTRKIHLIIDLGFNSNSDRTFLVELNYRLL